jgi:hypothetical protein
VQNAALVRVRNTRQDIAEDANGPALVRVRPSSIAVLRLPSAARGITNHGTPSDRVPLLDRHDVRMVWPLEDRDLALEALDRLGDLHPVRLEVLDRVVVAIAVADLLTGEDDAEPPPAELLTFTPSGHCSQVRRRQLTHRSAARAPALAARTEASSATGIVDEVSFDDIRRIAATYVDRPRIRGDLRTQAGATGKCSIVSSDLVDDYVAAGYKARRVRFRGHRYEVPVPHPEGDSREEHLAVLVDGVVVDATRRQFDPMAPVPLIYGSVEEAGRHWREVFDDDTTTRTRALPAP